MPTMNQMRHGAAPEEHDAVRSVTHLVDSVAFGQKHAWRHHDSAMERAEELNGGDLTRLHSLAWNCQHSYKHTGDAQEHAAKLIPHIRAHPDIRNHIAPVSTNAIIGLCRRISDLFLDVRKLYDACFRLMEQVQRGDIKPAHQILVNLNEIKDKYIETEMLLSDVVKNHIQPYPMANDEYLRLTSANPMPDHPHDEPHMEHVIRLLQGYAPLEEN